MKAERRLPKSPKTTPWKTNLTMEKQLEDVYDVSPIKNMGEFDTGWNKKSAQAPH